jgi:mono/diheme cytochrome c family protein
MFKLQFWVPVMLIWGLVACDGQKTERIMAPGSKASTSSGDAVAGGGDQSDSGDNPQDPAPPEEPQDDVQLVVAYQETVKPIIDNSCVGCHNPQGQASQLSLETYDQVVAAYDQALARVENDAMPMPPNAGADIRADLSALLNEWQTQGFLESAPQ